MKKLYVGNLPWSVNNQSLADIFSKYTSVVSAIVINDKETNRSRGFGFVEFSDDAEAEDAVKTMNGFTIDDRALIVNEARPREN